MCSEKQINDEEFFLCEEKIQYINQFLTRRKINFLL